MAITFNPDTGIVVEDTATIRARLVEQWQKLLPLTRQSRCLTPRPKPRPGSLSTVRQF